MESNYNYKGYIITPEILQEFRDWLIECIASGIYRDIEADEAQEYVNELTNEAVCNAVARQWDGGIEDAIICCTPIKY